MLITDHINFLGLNPLVGPNDEAFGPRLLLHERRLGCGARRDTQVGRAAGRRHAAPGRLCRVSAVPSFETPARSAWRRAGAATRVGMSSVPDCLIARHCGLKVVGVSCITNMGAGLSDEQLSHAHTLENASKGASAFERLVLAAVQVL